MDEVAHGEDRDEEALSEARGKVCGVFDTLGISYEVVMHPPIYSAFDRVRQEIVVDALICKNLFLRNKDKSRYYLFTLPLDKRADLAALQKALGETRLSFGDADALREKLRIAPGSVSLLNIIGAMEPVGKSEVKEAENEQLLKMQLLENISENTAKNNSDMKNAPLKYLVDAETLAVPRIGVHPNDNAATIVFSPDRLPELFAHYKADFAFIAI